MRREVRFLYMTYFTVMLQMVVGMQFNVLVITIKIHWKEEISCRVYCRNRLVRIVIATSRRRHHNDYG